MKYISLNSKIELRYYVIDSFMMHI